MRALVIFLGVLIFLGLGVLIWGIATKANKVFVKKQEPTQEEVFLNAPLFDFDQLAKYQFFYPKGMVVEDFELKDRFLMVHLKQKQSKDQSSLGRHHLMIIDLIKGKQMIQLNLGEQP